MIQTAWSTSRTVAMSDVHLPMIYGNNRDAYYCRDPEVILSGPADTGKTITKLTKLHWLAHKYDDASIVIARKQLTDIGGTVLQTWQRYIVDETVKVYGGARPQWYDYPNGSRVWFAGLDRPGKILSGEHDIIYVNQAEELTLIDWETLTTRTTGRAGHVPYNQTIGDCNPAHKSHWIKSRADSGLLTLFNSTHEDNPELYDQRTGEITPEGEKRIGALDRLTGVRKLRLRHGLWASPEGAIYDVFDEERHKVAAFPVPAHWPRAVGIDPMGVYRAAVWLAWDAENRVLNAYRELLLPFGSTVARFVERVKKLTANEPVMAWVCGAKSERDWRTEFQAVGLPVTEPPISDVWIGIDKVTELLQDFRLVIHDSCQNLLSEIGEYSRKRDNRTGEFTDRIEHKDKYHGLDCLRYAVVWLATPNRGVQQRVVYEPFVIGG